jgi:hypothetical protein
MPRCPLCQSRSAKRLCPAKGDKICPICCGTKREVEIDCPSDCAYLRSGRDYEAEKRAPDPELAAKAYRFDDAFIHKMAPLLNALSIAVLQERAQSRWLVDNDVIEALKALRVTLQTLSSGLYYESMPTDPVRQSLFRRIKDILDQAMAPQESIEEPALKVSEALDVLEFLTFAAQVHSSVRPKTRRYLDWLATMAPPEAALEQPSSGLILP